MRDPSLERKKPTPFLKVVLLLPWDFPPTIEGTIMSANKLASLLGPKVKINPGRRQRFQEESVFVGKQRLLYLKYDVYLPW